MQAKRGAGFHLPLVNRLDAGAHDLGDEGRRIGRQRQRQRHEFRYQARASGKIEALEFGNFKRNGRTENQVGRQRQSDQRAENVRPDGNQPAALEQLTACIASQQQRGDDPDQDGDRERLDARIGDRPGNHKAAVREKEAAEQRDALAGIGQGRKHGEIPEQDLEQQRQVAYQLDVASRDARQQPVRRQPAQRNHKSDHGRKENADDRDQERVEQTHKEHASIRVRSGIRDQVLADVETRRVLQEPQTGRDPLRLQIGTCIGHDLITDPDQGGDEQYLEEEPTPARATADRAPQPGCELRRRFSGLDAHRRGRSGSDQRIGGAY